MIFLDSTESLLLKLINQSIIFSIRDDDVEKFEKSFLDKDNLINSYYNQYRAYELEYSIQEKQVKIVYSKFGLIEIKNAILKFHQANAVLDKEIHGN